MTVEKSELRASAFGEAGALLDDKLEALTTAFHQLRGEKAGLVVAGKAVEGLIRNVDAEVAEGKLDLPQAELVKRWLVRVGGALQNLAVSADARTAAAGGACEAMRGAVAAVKVRFDAERAKSQADDIPQTNGHLEGTHPGPPVKELRKPDPDPAPTSKKKAPKRASGKRGG